MAVNRNILIIGELEKEELSVGTREIINMARQVSEYSHSIIELLVFSDKMEIGEKAILYGADKIYVVTTQELSDYNCDVITNVATKLCQKNQYSLCLLSHNDTGRDVAPKLAFRLNGGLCMDCIEIAYELEEDRYLMTRPVYGGKAFAVYASQRGQIQIATIRPKSIAPAVPDVARKGEVEKLEVRLDAELIKVKKVEENIEIAEEKLEDAKIIVAGGGGVGGIEGFEMLKELAELLGGAVGATRVPVDEKWVPLNLMIGQTGKIVNPDLYIAVGISGAAQHITGILSSKKIVAINRDPDANIFKVADIGVVSDYRVILPMVIRKMTEYLAGK